MILKGRGAYVYDADGRRLLDLVGAYGPLILGHADARVLEALNRAARDGGPFGATSEAEIRLGEVIRARMPAVERLRFVNSGTEAAMSALRLARGATGRDLVVKFAGGYHGHADSMLVKAGSGALTMGQPNSAGVPAAAASLTLVCPYNDLAALEEVFDLHRGEIAAVIVEPVAANMGVVPPVAGFLDGLRSLTRADGALLIFDEVITGFRVAPGGAQELFRVTPDLTVLGKIIGGGLPVGAFGGRRELMELVAPSGPVYQAGTLSGHPWVMAAGLATLEALDAAAYRHLDRLGACLERHLARAGAPLVTRVASLVTPFMADAAAYAGLHRRLRTGGVMAPPSQYEAWFLSTAHAESDLDLAFQGVAV